MIADTNPGRSRASRTLRQAHARACVPLGSLFNPGLLCAAILLAASTVPAAAVQPPDGAIAIVGATIIDGNGGPPLSNATIVVEGRRITQVGPRNTVDIPAAARIIDGTGKYVTPGFIDTNVHLNLSFSWDETNARYWHRNADITLQAAQLHLKHGVTTVRDSYGALRPGIEVRDAIARGEVPGPRMYVAGNIVGWGGPYSETFSGMPESELTLFQEQINDSITLGTGEELMHMTPEELRVAMNAYLDLGPDFIKYGGTSHMSYPAGIMFSPRAQRVIVEETHKRGLVAETHSATLEGLRLSVLAGIDLIQHPRSLGRRYVTDELLDLIVERGVICSGLQNTITGEAWQWHLEQRASAEAAQEEAAARGRRAPLTSAEIRRNRDAADMARAIMRSNAEKLIEAGCITSVGTDNLTFGHRSAAPEFERERHVLWEHQAPGIGTVMAIEGLVELGMTPSEAIVAATKHGALACRALDDFGTLEVGKLADLLVLGADPLADISNIRELEVVMKEGQVIETGSLPTDPVVGPWGEAPRR